MFNLNEEQLEGMVGEYGDTGPLLVETIGAGQEPEFDEETRAMLGLEAQMDDLMYLMSDIGRAGGMCQDFATEAYRIIPEFETHNPIGYFSKQPSATRLSVSMEEIHKAWYGAIAAVAAAVMYAIYRFVRWLCGDKDSGDDKDVSTGDVKKKADDAKEKIKAKHTKADVQAGQEEAMAESIDKTRGSMDQVTHGQGDSDSNGIFQARLGPKSQGSMGQNYLKFSQGKYYDIISNGPYTQAVERLGNMLGGLFNQLKNRFTTFSATTASTGPSGREAALKHQNDIQAVMRPVAVPGFGSGVTDLPTLFSHLTSLKNQVNNTKAKTGWEMELSRTLHALSARKKSASVNKLFQIEAEYPAEMIEIAEFTKQLEGFQKQPVSTDDEGNDDIAIRPLLIKAARQVQHDFMMYLQISAMVSGYTKDLVAIGEEMNRTYIAWCREVEKLYKDNGFGEVPDELEETAQHVKQEKSGLAGSNPKGIFGRRKK